uniref:Uncharacterized protein n=1 Tax=Triticum urartu TaxID=4572 RepID=A0A8R7R8X6_TRIUA
SFRPHRPTAPNPDPNDGHPCASTADCAAGSRASSRTSPSAGPSCRAQSQPATRGRSAAVAIVLRGAAPGQELPYALPADHRLSVRLESSASIRVRHHFLGGHADTCLCLLAVSSLTTDVAEGASQCHAPEEEHFLR